MVVILIVRVLILDLSDYRSRQLLFYLFIERVHLLSLPQIQSLENVVFDCEFEEIEMYFVGNLAVSDTFIVCFEIVTNDPFWVESLQSKSACPVYEHWFFLQDESVADFWIF